MVVECGGQIARDDEIRNSPGDDGLVFVSGVMGQGTSMRRYLRTGAWPQHGRAQHSLSASLLTMLELLQRTRMAVTFRGGEIEVGKESRDIQMISPAIGNKKVGEVRN